MTEAPERIWMDGRVTQDQKQLVRLALSKLKSQHERKLIDLRKEYESEKARLEAMLCQNCQKK